MKKIIVYIFLLLLVSCNNPRNNSLKEIVSKFEGTVNKAQK